MSERKTPETDALIASGKAHYMAVALCRKIERERDAAVEALKMAREELAGLPHSLGYEFTHLPKIDTVLAEIEGKS